MVKYQFSIYLHYYQCGKYKGSQPSSCSHHLIGTLVLCDMRRKLCFPITLKTMHWPILQSHVNVVIIATNWVPLLWSWCYTYGLYKIKAQICTVLYHIHSSMHPGHWHKISLDGSLFCFNICYKDQPQNVWFLPFSGYSRSYWAWYVSFMSRS